MKRDLAVTWTPHDTIDLYTICCIWGAGVKCLDIPQSVVTVVINLPLTLPPTDLHQSDWWPKLHFWTAVNHYWINAVQDGYTFKPILPLTMWVFIYFKANYIAGLDEEQPSTVSRQSDNLLAPPNWYWFYMRIKSCVLRHVGHLFNTSIYSVYRKYSDPLKFFTLCYITAICKNHLSSLFLLN